MFDRLSTVDGRPSQLDAWWPESDSHPTIRLELYGRSNAEATWDGLPLPIRLGCQSD